MKKVFFCIISLSFIYNINAKELITNAVKVHRTPEWLTSSKLNTVIQRIENKLEWSIRRISVFFYYNQNDFESRHSLGPQAIALAKTIRGVQSILLGPQVTKDNFDGVFGHELVHVVFYQKYKDAIPEWLVEGLANHVPQRKEVDYKWLAKQPYPQDIRKMTNPFTQKEVSVSYHYIASQALAEMLDKKCGLQNLIRLSVERKMENYIKTYCQIDDINKEFKKWVEQNAIQRVPKRL